MIIAQLTVRWIHPNLSLRINTIGTQTNFLHQRAGPLTGGNFHQGLLCGVPDYPCSNSYYWVSSQMSQMSGFGKAKFKNNRNYIYGSLHHDMYKCKKVDIHFENTKMFLNVNIPLLK